MPTKGQPTRAELTALVASFALITAWSAVNPADPLTWWLEALPAMVIIALLLGAQRLFPVTRVTQWLVWALCVMMVIGAHYTYSGVPPFGWLRDTFDLSRNHYDRMSHIMQGITVAMVARELALRFTPIRPGLPLLILITGATLGVSAGCELVEWAAAEIFGGGAIEFLGMQGDGWDAQKDMSLALLGALSAQLLLRSRQNKALGIT